MYGGSLNDDGIAIFDSEENKVQYTQAVELADQLLKESAYTLSAPALVGIIYREGRQLTEKELWTEAEAQLTQEGVTSWFGGPNNDMIRNRVEKLKAESKDAATRVRQYLGMTGTTKTEESPAAKGGMGAADKPAGSNKPAGDNGQYTDFYQLRPEQQQTIVRNAAKNPVQQERFIRTFGQQTWDAEMKKGQGKPETKPEPKPAAGGEDKTPPSTVQIPTNSITPLVDMIGSGFTGARDYIREFRKHQEGFLAATSGPAADFRAVYGRNPTSIAELGRFIRQNLQAKQR